MKSILSFLFCCLVCCQGLLAQKARLTARHGMVVSAHPQACRVGVDILKKGGNAYDAAIAVQFALAVVYPAAGNIGGGGFMVSRSGEGKIVKALDFREKAPAQAYERMFQDASGNAIKGLSQQGGLASGVPGSVAGMWEITSNWAPSPGRNSFSQPLTWP
jgi:gamma-glutamyltranspeptidase/glutathione hydrolase